MPIRTNNKLGIGTHSLVPVMTAHWLDRCHRDGGRRERAGSIDGLISSGPRRY
jgi:hypothetical protein